MLPHAASLYVPWDIEIARFNFGANCGPIAFAVSTQMEVCDAMQYFPHFADAHRRWTNSLQMGAALDAAGIHAQRLRQSFPTAGLALIQWLGPWTQPDFFSRHSLRYTHWVAVADEEIFDPNAGQWLTKSNWSSEFASACLSEIRSASGWAVKYGFGISSSRYNCPSTSRTRLLDACSAV